MPNPTGGTGPVPAAPAVAAPINAAPAAAAPINAAPVHAAPVHATEEDSMAKEITKQSDFAVEWEKLYANPATTEKKYTDIAGNVSSGIVSEFHKSKHVSDKSMGRRKEAFHKKEELRKQANLVHEQTDVASPRASIEKDVDKCYTNDKDAFARMVRNLMDETTDFMEFKDDENFLRHYDESVARLKEMQALYSVLNQITEADFEVLNKSLKKAHLEPIDSLKEARQKALDSVYILDFYEAKIDVLRNPFYTVLKESDTSALTKKDKKKLADSYAAKNNPGLAAYFNALYRMDEAAGLGAEHNEDTRKAVKRFGNSGRTGKKWRVDLLSIRHEGGHAKWKDLTKISAGYKFLSKDQKKESDKTDPEQKTGEKINFGGNISLLNYKAKIKGAKASVKKKWKFFRFGANATAVAINTENELSAKGGVRYEKGKGFRSASNQGGVASVSVGGAAVQGRVKAGVDFGKVGNFMLKAKGKALTAKATASAKAGYIKWKDKDGVEHTDFAAQGLLEAGAALVEGEATASFALFGVKVGASFTGKLGGVGGTIGGAVTGSSVEASFGALLGLGFKLKFKVDISGLLDFFKNRSKKKKLKEQQKQVYTDKGRQRALPKKKPKAPGAGKGGVGAGPPPAAP